MAGRECVLAVILFALINCSSSTGIVEEAEEVNSGETPVVPPSPLPVAAAAEEVKGGVDQDKKVSFYMHDILGGSNPTARAVTGVVTNPALNAQVAFAKPNGANIPLNNGIPQNNNNNGILNNNNLPFLTGLAGTTANVFNNNGNNLINGGIGFPVTNSNQLPAGMSLQKVMFGTMTVFDDELTEGHELGSALIGKAQGFYIATSVEGTTQLIAFTAKFEYGGYVDSLSFFGLHRTQVSESHIAIIGGTGKFLNAEGFAIINTFPLTSSHQHDADGLHTLLHLTAYLSYP